MSNAFKTICNVELIENEIIIFDVIKYDDSVIEKYFDEVDIQTLKEYVTYFFYWFKNNRFNL